MASRPTAIKIGTVIYTVSWDVKMADGDWGETDHRGLEIRVSEGLEPVQQKKTLLHEILHGCVFEATGKDDPKLPVHQMIYALESPLFSVFQENQDLVKWLAAA